MNNTNQSPLGKKTTYKNQYDSSLLFPVARAIQRREIGIENNLPFGGDDQWTAYEISWLNNNGKPIVAIGEFNYSCLTPNIVESKSFKLYLNSFNMTQFENTSAVKNILTKDLSAATGGDVTVNLYAVDDYPQQIKKFSGICLDELDINCDQYTTNADLLTVEKTTETANEMLYSHLLKSNCSITHQPDWGSVQIAYQGRKINHANLLRYLISLREHNEFHEPCVERIFTDIHRKCQPEKLAVYARYTRRGGLDINPYRSNDSAMQLNKSLRLVRQ